ncbi:hypothetical protein HPB48_007904 [Haemaphysalis longicornis]|uniref:Uncharacterized protein n=1 Tax=Haemaphysalis longicornis TaxID=44386 RepID=A0A9J6G7Z4_HAELO|nr:hypothetical protein HPB48_007904 [Haemaphysalis longicornis]
MEIRCTRDWLQLCERHFFRSGTEEQYEEKEHLLQELIDLAREYNYKFRVRNAARQQTAAATVASQRAAAHSARDAATAACTLDAVQDLDPNSSFCDYSPLSDTPSPASQLLTAIAAGDEIPEEADTFDTNGSPVGQLSTSTSGGTSTAAAQLPYGGSHNASQNDPCKERERRSAEERDRHQQLLENQQDNFLKILDVISNLKK